jgi:hypothetical protein
MPLRDGYSGSGEEILFCLHNSAATSTSACPMTNIITIARDLIMHISERTPPP